MFSGEEADVDGNERTGIFRWLHSRRVPLTVLAVFLPLLIIFLVFCHGLEPLLIRRGPRLLPDFGTMFAGVQAYDPASLLLWYIGDISEGSFMKSIPASVLYILLSLFGSGLSVRLAEVDYKEPGPLAQMGRSLASALLSLLIACAVSAPFFHLGWLPTFTAFLMTQILIGFIGNSPIQCLTIAVLSGITMAPLSILIMYTVAVPLQLPGFVGGGLGMAIGTIIDCEIMRLLPWMNMAPVDEPKDPPARMPRRTASQARLDVVLAIFRDLGDMPGTGSAAGGVGLAVGLMLGWELNPLHGFYGGPAENLLAILLATSAIGICFHYPTFRRGGYAFTLAPLLTMGAIASTYENTLAYDVPALLVAAAFAPMLVKYLLEHVGFLKRWPASVATQVVAVLFTILISVPILLAGFLGL